MQQLQQLLESTFGMEAQPNHMHLLQLCLRASVVFFATLGAIRFAGRRFLAGRNPFDVLLAFILASMMARAINGSAPFWGTLGTGFFIALLYRGLAYLMCASHKLGSRLKGDPEIVIENGKINESVLNRNRISKHDLIEDMRLNGALQDINRVRVACVERNGDISVQRKSQVFYLGVHEGVETIRLEIEC